MCRFLENQVIPDYNDDPSPVCTLEKRKRPDTISAVPAPETGPREKS